MKKDHANPLNMIPDPFAGDTFILPDTLCTNERRAWFRRANEILAFNMIATFALQECGGNFQKNLDRFTFKEKTPIKIETNTGMSVVTPVSNLIKHTQSSIAILTRQVF